MKRRTFLGTSAASLALPAMGRAQSARVLKYIPQTDLSVMDPVWTTAYVARNHGYLVYDTLYGQAGPTGGYRPVPQMVAGHVVEDDGKTWKLRLREGLAFHDGQRVLARDCVASVRRWGARDPLGQSLMQRTDELAAADDRTILFRLKRPFPLLPYALGKIAPNMCAMMPERLAAIDPFKQIVEAVGSGPFRFNLSERTPGSLYVYERFQGYQPCEDGAAPEWTAGPKMAHFDRIEWHVIPDPATAAAALQSGEADGWELAANDLLPLLARSGKLKRELVYETGICSVMRPNHLFPPFDERAVCRALLPAVSQVDVMQAVAGTDPTLWKVPCGFFPPASPMASDAGMTALNGTPDYDRAKRELQAAGYNGEKVVVLSAVDYPTVKAACDVVADAMTRAGMNVDYQGVDVGTMFQRRASKKPPAEGGWSVFCTGFSGSDFFTPATHQLLRGNGAQAWFGWPTDEKIEALREQWFDAPDLDAQKRIAAEIQVQAFADVPYVPLGLYYNYSVFRTDLTGILHGFPIFWNIRRV